MNSYSIETLAVHAGYETDEATMSVTPPLYETNAYVFKDAEHARTLFELKEPGNIYSRLQNPTCDILERKVTAMDGGVAALSFASGHAAIFNTIINLCSEGDELVSSINIYGGAINLLGITLKRMGITVKFVDPDDLSAWENAVTDKTRLFFTELIGNPNANGCRYRRDRQDSPQARYPVCSRQHLHNTLSLQTYRVGRRPCYPLRNKVFGRSRQCNGRCCSRQRKVHFQG